MIGTAFRNPYAVIAAALALIVLGINTVVRLPIDNFPEINIPVVMVATFYQGFSPEEMDKAITSRIERAFTQASHLEHIEAKSYNGVSLIKVFFQPGTDVGSAESELISLENNVLRKLPKGTNPSTFLRFDVSNVPVCQVLVHSKHRTEAELYDLAQFTIRQQLASIPGVAIWPSFGGKVRQIVVKLNRDALEAHDMTPYDIVKEINASNLILPGGNADVGTQSVQVEANTQIPAIKQIDEIPLKADKNGTMVYVKDVAHTEDGAQIQTNAVRVDGKRSVVIPVGKAVGGNTIQIVDGVKRMLPNLVGVPDDVKLDVVFDQSQYIRGALRSLGIEALLGTLLAAGFMWLVLRDLRAMLAVLVAVPLSLVAALIGLASLGESLNSMTLGGIALSIGPIVTNAIVVLENTYRHLAMGKAPRDAALDGAREVGVPLGVATVGIFLVFMPLQLLSGISRYLFVPLGTSVSLAMGASYVLAMTLLPLYCARFLKPRLHERENTTGMVARARAAYDRCLAWVFGHRKTAVAAGLVVWAASLPLVSVVGLEFFPRLDFGEIMLSVHAPTGYNLDQTEALVARIEDRIKQTLAPNEIAMGISNMGLPQGFNSIFSSNAGTDRATIQLQLSPPDARSRSMDQIMQALRDDVTKNVPEADVAFRPSGVVMGVVNGGLPVPIDLQIYGPNMKTQEQVAHQVIDLVRHVPGTVGVRLSQNLAEPYLDVNVDREKAGLLGMDEQAIADNLITAISSNLFIAPSYWLDPKNGNDYFLVVQQPESTLHSFNGIRSVPLQLPGGTGGQLRQVATLENRTGPQEVDQMNLRPVLDVETDLAGRDLGATVADLRGRLATLKLPAKTRVDVAGQAQTLAQAELGFGSGLVLAGILLYLLIVSLFRSFSEPLVALFGAVFGVCGVLWGLWLGGSSLNVQSMLGLLMLLGLTAYHGVLLVAAARQRFVDGVTAQQAAIEACHVRLRPTLMALAATILGLAPSAFKTGMHAEPNTALAQALIGGLITAMAATFLLVPMAWALVARRSEPEPDDEPLTTAVFSAVHHAHNQLGA